LRNDERAAHKFRKGPNKTQQLIAAEVELLTILTAEGGLIPHVQLESNALLPFSKTPILILNLLFTLSHTITASLNRVSLLSGAFPPHLTASESGNAVSEI